MKRLSRRMLFFSSMVVFLAVSPLVILYAMGYRTGASSVDPVPVGVILVESAPHRAEVAVDGSVVGKTPQAVSNLKPGRVGIKVAKEGYVAWDKAIEVEPGFVTELRAVRLFPTEPRVRIMAERAQAFSLSPNRQLVAVVGTDRTLRVADVGDGVQSSLLQLAAIPSEMAWAPNGSALLLTYRDRSVEVVEGIETTLRRRSLPGLTGAKVVRWDPRVPARLLVQTAGQELRAYNLTSQSSVVLARDVTTFATSDRNIFGMTGMGELVVYTLLGEEVRRHALGLDEPVAQVLVTPAGAVALVTANGKLWWLEGNTLVVVTSGVRTAAWSTDGQLLLVQSDKQALSVYNALDERAPLPMGQLQLVTRLTRAVKSPQWFAGGGHILYQVDDELWVTEIDTRDHPIAYQIDTTNHGLAYAEVGEDGERVFYLKKAANGQVDLAVAELVVE